ncbi:hypothetical protein [Deinococcus apachensis]|uniref:hypothetical protein n=1 Tax=Deinococcus apachensis TaxID=309886 RepID=UPI00037A0B36|nr:hypothetical protein [Deinococcus apachensis]
MIRAQPSPSLPHPRDDRVRPATRRLAAFVLPFLIVAFALLFFWPAPGDTERLFAWTIRPPMTAMMLAAAYLGGILFFVQVLRQRWHHVAAGFPAVGLFAGLLGIATVLHWDRFHPGHVSFIAWAGLYFTTPFLVLAAWWVNRTADPGTPDERDLVLPRGWRLLLACAGVVTLALGLLLFLRPGTLIGVWPWALTPLTARVVGALFTLPGVVGLSLARDGRWSAARVLLQAQALGIVAILVGVARDRASLDWGQAAAWWFVLGLSAMLGFCALALVTLDRRARRGEGA